MAEAYFNSLQTKHTCSSSGIRAHLNLDGPITWLAMRIIRDKELVPYMSMSWEQTTSEHLEKADMVIFMQQLHYNACIEDYGFSDQKYEIWDVEDVDHTNTRSEEEDIKFIRISEDTFAKIKEKTDTLVEQFI